MKPLTSAPKGTRDVLPSDCHRWHYVERTALSIAEDYGFLEMRTPTFEHTELFTRAVGDTTDVVQKEMYTFNDKADRSISLRPEGTSGVMRAAIENSLLEGQLPLKAFYNISCFRYEKPQAGRLREFHQFGVETVGSFSPAADAEVIGVGNQIIKQLGVDKYKLFINSIGCKTCRPPYKKMLRDYFEERKDELCPTCLGRLDTNPLRIIDCKIDKCKHIAEHAPMMIDHLCPDCEAHFAELRVRLDAMGLPYEIDPTIVRGLDYYVRTVFEFVTEAIGAQGTICGGGRYDGLVEEMGGPALPGVGWGMGVERLQMVMDASGAPFPTPPTCELFITPMGEKASITAGALISRLRAEGVFADADTMGRSLKAQMRYADKLGAIFVMVLGDDELAKGRASIKNMETGVQVEISLGESFEKDFVRISVERQLNATTDAASKL